MDNKFVRTELLFGSDAMEKLAKAKVAVFGVGGVGGYVVEALVRSGVGNIDVIDNDTVCETNINRQIIATTKTIGRNKVDVIKERATEINPDIMVNTFKTFYLPENAEEFNLAKYDYVVDAIDTVAGKIALVVNAEKVGVPIISSMGAGNKLNPTQFEVADISKTSVCPLAKVMRHELKKRNISHLKVVYSKEEPITPAEYTAPENEKNSGTKKRQTPGSNAFVPSVVGLIIASEVIKDLIK